MLETPACRRAMGGNIGLPILAQDPLPEGGVYVLELSSYQIDLTQSLDCEVAALLNITPDHLDRYNGFEAYAASKAACFDDAGADHRAIVGTGI
jgi:UDP-N-acetylmuramoylalanine--D-glutamate ligase